MIELKQQELDKAFLDGATAADDAICKALRGTLTMRQIHLVSGAVFDMLLERVGVERLEALDAQFKEWPKA